MAKAITIVWFRQDLRLADNPALVQAAKQGHVLAVFILDDRGAGDYAHGAASRWWLHHSLEQLNRSLEGKLSVYSGNPKEILPALAKANNADAVYWNRCYEPWRIARDKSIKELLQGKNITVESFNGALLWEPFQVLKKDGSPYKVFTPYFQKGCLQAPPPRVPLPKPAKLNVVSDQAQPGSLDDLSLLPSTPWFKKLHKHWCTGEAAAQDRLQHFFQNGLPNYKIGRDLPGKRFVSRLSPHLHFGEISPNQVWYAIQAYHGEAPFANTEHFIRELAWREFSYSLLYHFPELPKKNLQRKFDYFPWQNNTPALKAWQRGETGYPLVDAGMRELWQTGYMHNRVRMVVGSFLVKNLRLSWRHGERWFWDCLVDADLANNSAGWQWIAGCGADAAPYFRIFNPITQGQKFDTEGEYTRRFVPELKNLPNKYLFCPWTAPDKILTQAGVKLGDNYPKPIVDLKTSREQALEAFSTLKAYQTGRP